VFAAAETNLIDQMVNTNVNRNVFRLLAQQWTQTTYTDESNYDITTRKVADAVWLRFYFNILNNLKDAKALVNAEKPIGAQQAIEKTNKLALIELLNIYLPKISRYIW
jgi:hypothetical protein